MCQSKNTRSKTFRLVANFILKTNSTLKAKAIPVTGRGGPYGCEILRLSHFLENRFTDGGEVVGRPLLPGRFLVLISIRG
jgi:hypothetical protein